MLNLLTDLALTQHISGMVIQHDINPATAQPLVRSISRVLWPGFVWRWGATPGDGDWAT